MQKQKKRKKKEKYILNQTHQPLCFHVSPPSLLAGSMACQAPGQKLACDFSSQQWGWLK